MDIKSSFDDAFSRRDFIRSVGIGTTGLFTGGLFAFQAYPRTNTSLVVRKDIASLKEDDPSVQLLKDAMTVLKKRSEKSPLDPSGWLAHVSQHATFCATNMYVNQVHYSWFLLPWHRGYLYTLERKLQEAVREPKLALHYWDWTKKPQVPGHYWGEKNPLNNPTRFALPTDEIPHDFINVGAALRAPNFSIFGGYPMVDNWDDQQKDGIAEQSFHNNIHNWIGGDMASFDNSGNDFIFTGHHGNLDRIWEAWLAYEKNHTNPTDKKWLEHTFYFTDEKGKPMDIQVKDLADTRKLGYSFDNLDLNPRFCNPFLNEQCPPLSDNIDLITAVNIKNKENILKEVSTKKRARAVIRFDRMELPYMPYCARVFLQFKGGSMLGAPSVDKYIGTFTVLPIGKPYTGILQKDVFLQIEIDGSMAEELSRKEIVQVILNPVPLRGRNIEVANIKLSSAALELVS